MPSLERLVVAGKSCHFDCFQMGIMAEMQSAEAAAAVSAMASSASEEEAKGEEIDMEDYMIPAVVTAQLEQYMRFWAAGKQQVMEELERVQRRTRELGKGVEDKPREEVLRELSLENGRLERDLQATFQESLHVSASLTSLLENVQGLLNVKDPTSLVFHLVSFLYMVYSFSRMSHTLLNTVGQQTETREQGDKSVTQAAAKPDSEAKTPAVAGIKKGKKHTDKTDRPVDDDSGEGSSMPPDTQSGVKPPDTQSEAEATDDTQSEAEPTDTKSEARPTATRSGDTIESFP
ncbi:hypothetical protein DUI87_31111 [Hirundo rustica rustica]|uniref:Uncharacterized protein n=1 Tax=Hirundo rustica rustica TaxID=333673 RepID=A0A3M0J116_HIRRU|nr:hypothetical protein DUI87_31111 [Hirundo rustica rustica]